MPDRDVPQDEEHPVAAGLIALIGVGLVVGLIAGLAALAGTQLLGLDDDDASAQDTTADSLYLPKPQKTTGSRGPSSRSRRPARPAHRARSSQPSEPETSKDKKPKKGISLSASMTEVSPMQQIDLTGVYPGGEGAILQVQRFDQRAGRTSRSRSRSATRRSPPTSRPARAGSNGSGSSTPAPARPSNEVSRHRPAERHRRSASTVESALPSSSRPSPVPSSPSTPITRHAVASGRDARPRH